MAIAENPLTQAGDQPFYARRNDAGYYTWKGVQLPSVTTILSSAPGQHLMTWYAKMAAMKAASHLYQAAIGPIPAGDEALREFVQEQFPRTLSFDAAIAEVMDWAKVMREAERYRDHKARIGSVVHHAIYEHALGTRVDADDVEDYLFQVADSLNLWRDADRPDFQPTEAMVREAARSAHAYVLSAYEWIEETCPEWEMVGQEATVVRMDPGDGSGYAGTTDCIFTVRKSTYRRDWREGWGASKRFAGDFKTSNALATSVQAQVEAYRHADFIGLVATGEEFEIPPSDGVAAIHIGPHRSMAGHQDEFGTLESRAKQIGARLYTWPANEETFQAFLGLCRWFNWTQDVPRPEQSRPRGPKTEKPAKGAPRPCPFG